MRKLLATALLAIATVASAQTTNLKVMSFNIRFDTPKDTGIISWKSRCQPCADVIHHVQPKNRVAHSMNKLLLRCPTIPTYAYPWVARLPRRSRDASWCSSKQINMR